MNLSPSPSFNILALALHRFSLCFLRNNTPSLSLWFPGFCIYCTVISLSAVIRLVQQNLNQMYSYSTKTGPISVDCCPRDSASAPRQTWQNLSCRCLAQEYLLGLVILFLLWSPAPPPFSWAPFSSSSWPGTHAS